MIKFNFEPNIDAYGVILWIEKDEILHIDFKNPLTHQNQVTQKKKDEVIKIGNK
jgi:hypothetical protein